MWSRPASWCTNVKPWPTKQKISKLKRVYDRSLMVKEMAKCDFMIQLLKHVLWFSNLVALLTDYIDRCWTVNFIQCTTILSNDATDLPVAVLTMWRTAPSNPASVSPFGADGRSPVPEPGWCNQFPSIHRQSGGQWAKAYQLDSTCCSEDDC